MQRALLFWGVCIPLRYVLAAQGDQLWLRAAAAVISTRWLAGYETAHVGFFGGPAWWADERKLHGALWLGYAATGQSAFLYFDTHVGVANWLTERSTKFSF